MEKLVVEGGKKLKGEVEISGSKNSTLPILAATLLTEAECVITNVPELRDITTMLRILRALGVKVNQEGNTVTVKAGNSLKAVAPWKLVSTMRASVCVLGPLLARTGYAEVSMPGGCVIGARPIDLHLKGLAALGASVEIEHGYVKAKVSKFHGADIYLGGAFGSSVLATDNVMMAAVLAKGVTRIENAACEPEVVDLANFLNQMGAKITGAGSPLITIEGVAKLHGVQYSVIPDRIEAGTFMVAAAITQGELAIHKSIPEHNGALIHKLRQAGVTIDSTNGTLRIKGARKLKPVDVTTLPYPGFPTDLQAQMMSLMSVTLVI
jgi:UDP-N-acetylglucosamine 1-carboxyvinyltransferase